MNLDKELNKPQKEVVTTTEGPLLVLAGAGSGKTRSVIYRAGYLINEKNVNPWNILIVTFTNRAARELKQRLYESFGIRERSLWIGTFHSVCARILRAEEEFLPFKKNFSIFDDGDQKSIIKKIMKELDLDPKKFSADRIRGTISKQKNSLILPKDFFEFNESNYFTEIVHTIYEKYQQILMANNAMDFDDILMYTALLLHDNKAIQAKYERKFKYVMIDEYQDTNYAQFKLVNLFAQKHQNLCVVGDDDQAIYSWRGADIRNILNFSNDYKKVKTIKLEQNYRSPENILNLANSLIKNNSDRHEKELWTEIRSEILPQLRKSDNEYREAESVAKDIKQLKQKGSSLDECVVLYRTNAQSRVFENVFIQEKINYQIIGGVNFYQRKEIKDVMAYLKLLGNSEDSESLIRCINTPARGIGQKTLGGLIDFALRENISPYDALWEIDERVFRAGTLKKIRAFAQMMEEWKDFQTSVPELINRIYEDTGMMQKYDQSTDPRDFTRAENLKELLIAAQEFCDKFEQDTGEEPELAEFLQNISLQTDLDNVAIDEASVKLMTMHNAKGLEYDHVYVVGLEDGLLPHSRSIDESRNLEEERRLLYVAITRARKTLKLSYAQTRRTYDSLAHTIPSRFIMELESKYYEPVNCYFYEAQPPVNRLVNGVAKKKVPVTLESEKLFKVGQKVLHDKFGDGVILNVNGTGGDAKLTVSFSSGELKKIVGSFVKLK